MPIKIDSIEFFPIKITAITPTGDRPLAFALCKHWMEKQMVKPDQWIVVDDGKVPMTPPVGATYVRREPRPNDPPHTLNVNLKAALPYIRGEQILIIEDDEYYAPGYVAALSSALEHGQVAGIGWSKYYHLPIGGYARHANSGWASLAQTGFTRQFIHTFTALLDADSGTYLDLHIWRTAMNNGVGYLFCDDDPNSLYVGIKGLPGRRGIGVGHDTAMYAGCIDSKRTILKTWITKPQDYKVYLDILSGKLNDANCNIYFPQITGITVCQNTKDLMQRAYESVRRFHPDMPIIIIDGSDANDPCYFYTRSLQSNLTTVIQPGYNIGHGRGMCLGIDEAQTPYALIFDSDIEMLKSPVDAMFAMMESDTFGVGYIEKTGYDGYEYGANLIHEHQGWMRMLHPYFHLINIANYRKFHPYVHHGAPTYLTCFDIHKRGLSDKIIKEFPGLGHSSGKGWVWEGKPREFIRHDPAGTRSERVKRGLGEIEPGWVHNTGQV
ncbi:MAG: glycosyltransferase family 2 protein [Candidatus Marinimicrobia bacterium]|nr:glycosyltransferase family 2 protein [Candidatus Neomarinimicrobiota bacterium]